MDRQEQADHRTSPPTHGAGGEIFTVEALWHEHGARLVRLARRLLDDRGSADAASHAVLVRAAAWLDLTARPVPESAAWWWLERLCHDVSREIGDHGVDPAWVTGEPLPRSVPERLRARLRSWALETTSRASESAGPISQARHRDRARWRELFDRKLRDLPVVVLLPGLVRRAAAGTGRAARAAWRRSEALSPASMSTQRVVGMFAAGPGVLEAAAAFTVALAVGSGLSGSVTPPAPPPVPLAQRVEVAMAQSELEPPPDEPVEVEVAPPPVAPEPAPEPDATTEPAPDPEPEPEADPLPVAATVSADPVKNVEEPVQEDDWEGGKRYRTPSERVSVDADGDGEEDAFATTPTAGWNCPNDPDKRRPGSEYVCPVLEESGIPTEEMG